MHATYCLGIRCTVSLCRLFRNVHPSRLAVIKLSKSNASTISYKKHKSRHQAGNRSNDGRRHQSLVLFTVLNRTLGPVVRPHAAITLVEHCHTTDIDSPHISTSVTLVRKKILFPAKKKEGDLYMYLTLLNSNMTTEMLCYPLL